MKLSSVLSLIALAATPALSSAATPFLVDFEKTWSYGEAVDAQYAASGVTFTNVLGVSNDPDFGTYYTNAPSMQGVAMAQLDGVVNTSAFMNVADGVEGKLSFFYSTPSDIVGAIKAYSGLNGTGTLLGTFDFSANASAYDAWTAATFTFGGVAKSFDLTGTANVAGIDNISAVPEPTSLALCLASLGLIGLVARRRSA
jgi:hypothetical protein